jgi:hypothetical protein
MLMRLIGVSRNQKPSQAILRAEFMVILSTEDPKVRRWGRSEVLWAPPGEVLVRREEGLALVICGHGVKPAQLKEAAENLPDPYMLIAITARKPTDRMKAAVKAVTRRRNAFVAGINPHMLEDGETMRLQLDQEAGFWMGESDV